jgi:hypothetical protein
MTGEFKRDFRALKLTWIKTLKTREGNFEKNLKL